MLQDSRDLSEEGFVDFTTVTAWESFCAELEERLRRWHEVAQDTKTTASDEEDEDVLVCVLQTKLKQFRPENYSIAFHTPPAGHDLSEWLKLKEGEPFALLYPNSFSGCVLDREESTALLSALSCSIGTSKFPYAVLIPEKDRRRKAFAGIQLRSGGHVAKLHTDCITGSLVASEMHDVSLVRAFHQEAVAYALSTSKAERVMGSSAVSMTRGFDLTWTLQELEPDSEMCLWINDWNVDCPWHPWAEYEDPIESVRLDLGWDHLPVSRLQLDMGSFHALEQSQNTYSLSSLFELEHVSGMQLKIQLSDEMLSEVMWHKNVFDTMKRAHGGYFFCQMIAAYHHNFDVVERARGVSELALDSYWDSSDYVPQIPAAKLLNNQIESIFKRKSSVQNMGSLESELQLPTDSLLGYFSMYALSYGDNPRAISLLWKRFVSEIRLRFWEERELLPRMSSQVGIDHTSHVVEQKIQLIHLCILSLRNRTVLNSGIPISRSENPNMLTSDLISDFDYMFTISTNRRNRIEVWMKMHGGIAGKIATSFLKEHPDASFGDFKKHFQTSKYYCKFSTLCKSLRWNGFTKDRLKDVWQSAKQHHMIEEEDQHAVLCSRVEMALDWLEHVSPSELFKSLYCFGVSQAINTLSASRNLHLKPLADLLHAVKDSMLPNDTNTSSSTARLLDFHLLEVAMAFAESVTQKFAFLSEELKEELVDSFINKLITKEFSASPTLELNIDMSVGSFRRGLERASAGIMLLHLRRQVISFDAGDWFTYLCQDLDAMHTRYSTNYVV